MTMKCQEMSNNELWISLLVHLKDNIIIISLFHIYYHQLIINYLTKFTLLVILQYMMFPIRYKILYFNNKLKSIHKLFSYEFVYENYFGKQHLYLYTHEYHFIKHFPNMEFYQKESYFNEMLVIYNYCKLKIKDYFKKPDYDCAICLVEGDNWIELPCKHKMHLDCIKSWFVSSNNISCPLCMKECSSEFISLLI